MNLHHYWNRKGTTLSFVLTGAFCHHKYNVERWRYGKFALLFSCRRATEYKRCVDDITCTESDDLYQLYLAFFGAAEILEFLCSNDIAAGSRGVFFLNFVSL